MNDTFARSKNNPSYDRYLSDYSIKLGKRLIHLN